MLALPAMARINDLPPDARAALRDLLKELGADAHERAWAMWRKNKGPMAAYWMAVRAYAGNTRRAIRA